MPRVTLKTHEIRDPIHTFIRMNSHERAVVDSAPYQRLRNIHQLALTYLVYPGATHTRFEHCLGVMDLASRIFDVITAEANLTEAARELLPPRDTFGHWRLVLRLAALCHDVGHLPFSHAAETELLPEGVSHEDLSRKVIESEEMKGLWSQFNIRADEVAKLAIGPEHYPEPLTEWETLLAEIITGDAFGADRMDYLLRDAYHAGVAYGRFEHHRLIDSMRILPQGEAEIPALGIEQGGIQSAESLLWARYLMYTQLYFHHVRRIYDFHLQQFLSAWLPNGKFGTEVAQHLAVTDAEVIAAMRAACNDPALPGHVPARRIIKRQHFRMVADFNAADRDGDPMAASHLAERIVERFGAERVRLDSYRPKSKGARFPVLTRDGKIEWSTLLSATLNQVPTFAVEYVFVDPEIADPARAEVSRFREELDAARAAKKASEKQGEKQ
jgi:HD superfamily phosphohydrolase